MQRQNQAVAREEAASEPPRDEAEAPPLRSLGVEGLRAEIQRRLAAQIDLSTPEDEAPPRPQPAAPRPRIESMRAEVQRRSIARPAGTASAYRPSRFSGLRVNRKRAVLVGIALIAGFGAAYLIIAGGFGTPAPAPAVAAIAAPPVREASTQVLVAKGAIPVGQRLSADNLEWQDWPVRTVREGYITVAASPGAMTDLAGSIVRNDFVGGEPIRKEKLAQPSQGYLSAVLDSGMRAVSVPITADDASGGFIAPNDYVDVVVTRTINGRSTSDTVLSGVRVLAVNDQVSAAPKPDEPVGPGAAPPSSSDARAFANSAIATLELNPTQSEVIITAEYQGKLALVLRSLTDIGKADPDADYASNEAIRLSSPFWTTGSSSGVQPLH